MPDKPLISPEEHTSFQDDSFAIGFNNDGSLNTCTKEEWPKRKAEMEAEWDAMLRAIAEVYPPGEGTEVDLDSMSDEELDDLINSMGDEAEE